MKAMRAACKSFALASTRDFAPRAISLKPPFCRLMRCLLVDGQRAIYSSRKNTDELTSGRADWPRPSQRGRRASGDSIGRPRSPSARRHARQRHATLMHASATTARAAQRPKKTLRDKIRYNTSSKNTDTVMMARPKIGGSSINTTTIYSSNIGTI